MTYRDVRLVLRRTPLNVNFACDLACMIQYLTPYLQPYTRPDIRQSKSQDLKRTSELSALETFPGVSLSYRSCL